MALRSARRPDPRADPRPGETVAPRPEAPVDRVLRWVTVELFIVLGQSAVLALVLLLVLISFGTRTNLMGAWAVAAVAVLAVRVHRAAMPATARRRSIVRSVRSSANAWQEQVAAASIAPAGPGRDQLHWLDPLPPTLERRFNRLYRHVDRLSYAVVAARHYDSGVRPVLAELARDRLRRHHGIDLAEEPARARAALGEDLWRAMTGPTEHAPTTEDLDRWLTQLERLDPGRPDPTPGELRPRSA